jgi:hypothetical protein
MPALASHSESVMQFGLRAGMRAGAGRLLAGYVSLGRSRFRRTPYVLTPLVGE